MRRTLGTLTRVALRVAGSARSPARPAAPGARGRAGALRLIAPGAAPTVSFFGVAGGVRCWLYKPPGVDRHERLPLMVMLHGCGQDAQALAASSRMNRIAARERFLVLYPEQSQLANAHRCWNWYDTRSGRGQREALAIGAAIDQVCRAQPVDPTRIALAGLSAGAGMAALLATLRPDRCRALAMHSGIVPGVADSFASALGAMGGLRVAADPLRAGQDLPALLVIHGSADHVVALGNAVEAVRWWAAQADAVPTAPRRIQRGARYPALVTDFRARGRIVATLCEITGLGHAWSGGAAGLEYSDPKGPDASRMIWNFAARQFAARAGKLESKASAGSLQANAPLL